MVFLFNGFPSLSYQTQSSNFSFHSSTNAPILFCCMMFSYMEYKKVYMYPSGFIGSWIIEVEIDDQFSLDILFNYVYL